MLKKSFCNIDMPVLGLGLMRLPKNDLGKIDYQKANQMVDYAIKNGIKYFDTAYPYHDGESEIFIGEALKRYERDEFYLASKMPIWEVKEKKEVREIFFKQLEKCQVEYFDFYLCHAMSLDRHNVYKDLDAYNELLKLKKEGYIKNLGFSFHDTPTALEVIVKEINWDFAQLQLNYLDWTMQDAKRQYEILNNNNIPCVVMEPVRGGALANVCMDAEKIFKEKSDKSIASWALRFVASLPNVCVVLSGMSNMEQLTDNINTFTDFKYLSEDDKLTIDKAKKAILGNKFIPCTGCKYCMPCPYGVNIARSFAIYNQYQIDKDKERFIKRINDLKEEEKFDKCMECGMCMLQCPQQIKIPQELKKLSEEM